MQASRIRRFRTVAVATMFSMLLGLITVSSVFADGGSTPWPR